MSESLGMEDLLAKHRKEKKDLQGKITQKKKAATKKTRKGVNDECERLERELQDKHAAEIAALNGEPAEGEVVMLSENQDLQKQEEGNHEASIEAPEKTDHTNLESSFGDLSISSDAPSKKPNRQKARLARRAAEQARMTEEAEREAANMPDQKEVEREAMNKAFKERGLEEKIIRADGHCLYAAVADQLRIRGDEVRVDPESSEKDDYRVVRHVAANYITSNPDDFVPFLEEDLQTYVHKVKDTGEWGGQIELTALSKAYSSKICVVQDGTVTEIGEGPEEKTMWLAYYRHNFGLGEHYNSLRKAGEKTS